MYSIVCVCVVYTPILSPWTGRQVGDGLNRQWRLRKSACEEHQVFHGSIESLNCMPEANRTLHVNYLEFK